MIDLQNISLQFGGDYLFKNINYKVNAGDRISLVGSNGTGKSSLLKIIIGEIQPEEGKIAMQKRISVGYLPQENVTHKGKSVFDEAKSALTDIIVLHNKEEEITSQLSANMLSDEERDDLIHQLGEVHHRLEELDSYSSSNRIEKILLGLGFNESDFNRLTDELSGGWQMRLALAKILISQNDVLLLDEPTNHLDLDSLEWLLDFLKFYEGAMIIVSHDKHFVNTLTNKTLEIFLGKFNTYKGNYESYLKFKTERDNLLEHQFLLQQKKIKDTERFIERFRYKNTKAKQVQSRIKQLEKIELIQLPESKDDIDIKFPTPPQSGRINIELNHISKSYGNTLVLQNLDFKIERGDKIAFVGPNGAGKTTLAKIIAGVLSINRGERILGHNTYISYYAQDVADDLDPEKDILETLDEISIDKTIGQLRVLLGNFLFTGDDVFKKVGILSGGEKSRVALAKILLTKTNLIILDEPTNHLDYNSKLILQKALIDFNGSLVLVSHDIDFLKPIVNKVVEIRKGTIKTFLGDIDYYLQKRLEFLNPDNDIHSKDNFDDFSLSRKEQKRLEAEKRQERHRQTKDLKEKILKLEIKISQLENLQKEIELALVTETIYSNSSLAREKNLEYQNIKDELNSALNSWEEFQKTLEEIELKFK
jgi:ATP-binding cassette subfamily F protein 3